jgi:hypothetical protein
MSKIWPYKQSYLPLLGDDPFENNTVAPTLLVIQALLIAIVTTPQYCPNKKEMKA